MNLRKKRRKTTEGEKHEKKTHGELNPTQADLKLVHKEHKVGQVAQDVFGDVCEGRHGVTGQGEGHRLEGGPQGLGGHLAQPGRRGQVEVEAHLQQLGLGQGCFHAEEQGHA